MRKELKIRPGFTPQEDVGRFRGSRQQASDASRGFVPGSTRARPPPENPFAVSSGSKTKSQLKNEKRREKKKAEGVNKAWDESDEESDGDIGEAFKAEAESRKATVNGKNGVSESERKKEDEGGDKPAWPIEDGGRGMISEGGPDGGGVPDDPIPIEPAVEDKKDSDEGETAILSPVPPGPAQRDPAAPTAQPTPSPSTPEWRTASSRKPSRSNKPHPIQGGRQGPIGLAHPPPIEQSKPTRPPRQKKPSSSGESGRKPITTPAGSAQAQSKATSEPRVRKEVNVRDTGLGSLADRVKNLVIANQEPEKKEKKERPAPKNEPAAAA